MPRATLIVQNFSYGYVAAFVHYLHDVLRRNLDPAAELVRCNEIADAKHAEGLVFLIGENFRLFKRRAGCTYVLLNLSVVTPLGSPLSASLRGHRQILRKRRLLAAKLPVCDILLDYYPPQTAVLRRKLGLPVLGFDYAVEPRSTWRTTQPQYDVCFVGGLTDRRQQVLAALSAKGIILSPNSGAPIEDIAAASRCCVNIHMERSNHLEIPRLVAALSNGCPVVTETSFGLKEFGASDVVIERPISTLAGTVDRLLADPKRLDALKAVAAGWYSDVYLPRAERRWQEICREVAGLAYAAA